MIRTRLVLLLALAGCAGPPPPEVSHYLLRAPVSGQAADADVGSALELGPIRVAPYLERAGVVVATGEHRVHEASFHLWAEPLGDGIHVYLRDRLSSLLAGQPGPARYRVDVSVEVFHGSLRGDVTLVARWALFDLAEGTEISAQRFSRTARQPGEGYPELVAAQMQLLDALADAIASRLREVDG